MEKMYNRKLKFFPRLFQKLAARVTADSFANYQPIFLNNKIIKQGERNCLDRWQLIKKEMQRYGVNSFLDLGCAEGFYVLKAAKECECFSVGIDSDVRRLTAAQNQIITEGIKSAGFIYGAVGEKTIKKLSKFDMVLFMSVLHHLMYSYGHDYCLSFLKQLRNKISKVMIFEMGQSSERAREWATKLPDMGKNPEKWIVNFLMSAGFSRVEKIGETDSYRSEQKRIIFRVEP